MTLKVIIKGPGNTAAELTPKQFQVVHSIILKMMNNGITRRRAEVMIADKLIAVGNPLVFTERKKNGN